MRNSPCLSSAVLLAESMRVLADRRMPPKWETLSNGLHTRSLPTLHAALGDCWSHNRSRPRLAPGVTRQSKTWSLSGSGPGVFPTLCRSRWWRGHTW